MKQKIIEAERRIIPSGDASIAYQNPFIRITNHPVQFPNGKNGTYSVITSGNGYGSVILPILRHRGLTYLGLIEQYRWPIQRFTLEFPRGGSDPDDKTSAETSYREMLEETGIQSHSILKLLEAGFIHPDTGIMDTQVQIHVAMIDSSELHKEYTEHETGAQIKWVSVPEFQGLIVSGKINCSMTISAFTMAQVFNPNVFQDLI